MRFDGMNSINPVVAIAPLVLTDNTAQASAALDTQGFEAATFVIATGTLADGDATFAVEVREGDTNVQSEHTAVADTELVGTEALAGFTQADDNACRKIGYVGSKRYVSLVITPTNNTGNAPLSAVLLLARPHVAPTDNPPA